MSWDLAPIRAGIENRAHFADIHAMLAKLIAAGIERDDILARLDQLRLEFFEIGNEVAEDATLDLMDCLVGWCPPGWHL